MSDRVEKVLRLKREAEEHFSNYLRHMRAGELWKAGEYLWGAYHALLLALASVMGKKVPARHAALRRFVLELADIMGDEGIYEAFKDGERLHANFYHPGLLDEEEAEEAILHLESCISKLAGVLEQRLRELSASNRAS